MSHALDKALAAKLGRPVKVEHLSVPGTKVFLPRPLIFLLHDLPQISECPVCDHLGVMPWGVYRGALILGPCPACEGAGWGQWLAHN